MRMLFNHLDDMHSVPMVPTCTCVHKLTHTRYSTSDWHLIEMYRFKTSLRIRLKSALWVIVLMPDGDGQGDFDTNWHVERLTRNTSFCCIFRHTHTHTFVISLKRLLEWSHMFSANCFHTTPIMIARRCFDICHKRARTLATLHAL